ncbi:unnamed protein product, partial [Laminaria digitata]
MAAAVCLLVGTTAVLQNPHRSAALDFRQLDGPIPRTEITLALSPKIRSYSEILWLQGVTKWEHAAAGGDGQLYPIPATKAGGWEIFSSRAVKKVTGAMELYGPAAITMG